MLGSAALTSLPLEILLVRGHVAGIILGRLAIIAVATGRVGVLSDGFQFSIGIYGSQDFSGAGPGAE